MISRLGILFMRAIAPLPLGFVRAMGAALGALLYVAVIPRRRIAMRNLELCFPHWSRAQRRSVVWQHFIYFAQAWLDRGWLWHATADVVRQRLKLTGAVDEIAGKAPVILFVPHFLGLDAGVSAITLLTHRAIMGVYTRQSNAVVDEWIFEGRHRFSQESRAVHRSEGVREMISAVRGGAAMYLLPDMNFGAEDSIFVPFYGVQAATLPSLPRFARLCRAKVVPLVTKLTDSGYEVRLLPSWAEYPTRDIAADTALMNQRLEGYIDEMPAQYYWVHKRFKSRPAGEPPVY
ncbi:MAG TPA: lipid A biosynthesis acyltransferase [Ramlibacter sp.]|nr:lipid A biosynthesis acyltransferase [Ramlibacter sp.]